MNKLMLSSLIMLLSVVSLVDARKDRDNCSKDRDNKHHDKDKHSGKSHRLNKHVAGAVGFDLTNCEVVTPQQQDCVCFACCDRVVVNPLSCRNCCFTTSDATLSVRPGPCCGYFIATLSFDVNFARPFCCEPVIVLSGEAEKFENLCVDRVTRQPIDLFSIIGWNRVAANVTPTGFTAVVEYVLNTCDQHNNCADAFQFISDYVSNRRLNFHAVVSCKKRRATPNF